MRGPVNFYSKRRNTSKVIGNDFLFGCNCETNFTYNNRELKDGLSAFYGVSCHTLKLYRKCVDSKLDYVYIDNGYFSPGKRGGYYRATFNNAQFLGASHSGSSRFNLHNIPIKPWRRSGSKILFVKQKTPVDYVWTMQDMREWFTNTCRILRSNTDRSVIFREKPKSVYELIDHSFIDYLNSHDIWAVVTHSSNAAVEALIEGYPVFVATPCAASKMGLMDFSKIENPIYPDGREEWSWGLADNQWTQAEMRSGQCVRELLNGVR